MQERKRLRHQKGRQHGVETGGVQKQPKSLTDSLANEDKGFSNARLLQLIQPVCRAGWMVTTRLEH